jgi:putative oxidoreductase
MRKGLDVGLLLIRIALGVVFIYHGFGKFFPNMVPGSHGIDDFAKMLGDMGMPRPIFMAYLAAGWELGGGIALILGLLTRLAAFGIFVEMTVAVFKVHLGNGFDASKGGFEYAMTLGIVALALAFTGAGAISLDGAFVRRRHKGV